MPKPKRSKQSVKNRARNHRSAVKAGRRVRVRSRADTAVSRSRRRARVAAKLRRFFGR